MDAVGVPPYVEPDVNAPLGKDPIADLSVPPLRTAGPNPHLAEFVARRRTPDRAAPERRPYEGQLRAASRHPVYAFHPYHTKVPPQVIRTLIEHYTDPGDLVLDGFCGSGMTGVAAREAGRHAVLCDLSPSATFVAGVNCTSHAAGAIEATLNEALDASQARWGHLYRTRQPDGRQLPVNYFVWSDVFTCPDCHAEFPFFPHGVVHERIKVRTRKAFPCPGCAAELNVRRVRRVLTERGKKKRLVWVNAGARSERVNRLPEPCDLELAAEVEELEPEAWYPRDPVDPNGYSAKLAQLGGKAISDVSRFLSRRNLIVLADLWERIGHEEDPALRQACRAVLTSVFTVISERQGYFGGGGGMSGNLYMPIVRMEKNVYATLRRKLRKLAAVETAKAELAGEVLVSTQSTTDLSAIPAGSIDYVYTDPPFGANIIYSEMNLLLEGWLRVRTTRDREAVIDPSRGRTPAEYADLLQGCFAEYARVLKPGRWLTVEFHNTHAEVWTIIQEAIGASGLEVVSVGRLDKGSSTILEDIRPTAARHDLLIHARKPLQAPAGFVLAEGDGEAMWSALADHLAGLPRESPERGRHELFHWMVAEQVREGQTVPLSGVAFLTGLRERFRETDGRFFL